MKNTGQHQKPATPVIEIKGLDYAYGRQPVLKGVDLTILAGDCVALLGPNGGGKTTLIKLCLGLLKPTAGSVCILGSNTAQGLTPVRDRLGYVPQEINRGGGFPITVNETVLLGRITPRPGLRGWSRKDREKAGQALNLVGLWELRKRRIDRLSGGQRQRMMIARALVSEPELLFLDEPTASVDRKWQAKLYDVFEELNKKTTLVLVSHDLGIIASHVKSVACVNQKLHYHPRPEITPQMLKETYQCPVELVAHGIPHRVLAEHYPLEEDPDA